LVLQLAAAVAEVQDTALVPQAVQVTTEFTVA